MESGVKEKEKKFCKIKKSDILPLSSKDESIKYVGNKIPIEKSPLQWGFFFIMTDGLFASSHKTLQIYRYCYCDQATLPKYWKFKRELLHKIHGLENKMPIAPFGSKEPE